MAEDLVTIGIAYNTSQLLTGARQVQEALRQVEQAEKSAQTATKALEQSSTQAAQAMGQERAAASGAASSTQQLSQASVQAASALTQTASAASRAAQATATVGQQASTASGLLTTLAQQALAFGAGQLAITGVASAFAKVKDALSGAAQSAMQLESMTATFKAIGGSSQVAARDMDFLRQTANRLGVDFTSLAKGFTTLAASAQNTSLSGAAVRDIFTAIAEKGRVLGKSAEDINGAMLAVGQSISKGTIQAEELRGQLSERLPGAFNDMARAMGVSTAELNKLLEAGQVGIENWKAWAAVVRSDLGGATQEAARTASAELARLGNATGELSVTIGKALLPALSATVTWLTNVVTAANDAIKSLSAFDEARRKSLKEAETLAGGPGAQVGRQQELVAVQDEIRRARDERKALEQYGGGLLGNTAARIEAARQRELDAIAKEIELKRQLESVNKRVKESDPLGEGAGIEPGAVDEKRIKFQADLTAQVKKNREELEQLHTVSQQLYGRKASEEEILKLREKQTTETVKLIQSNQQLWNLYKDTGPAKALREHASGTEALEKAMKDAAAADRQGKKDTTAEAREAEKARKDALDATLAKGKAIYEQNDDVVQLLSEMQRRQASLAMTEEERFRERAEALAKEHPALAQLIEDELKRYEAAKAYNDELKDRPRRLADEAAASAERLTNVQRAMQQFAPRRRGESTEERLGRSVQDLSNTQGATFAQMTQAREQMDALLKAEEWDRWRDAGMEAMEDITTEFAQMAFHGKLSFTNLANHAVEQLFRIATESSLKALGKVDWGGLLQTGLSLVGLAGSMPTWGTLPTTEAAYTAQAAAGRFSGRQSGGPVTAGQPYWVGERGPELVIPRQSGVVLPHNQSMGLSSPTFVFNLHGVTDAQGIIASRGAIQRTVAQAVQASYRAM
jgi:tape measure domain-containing protein